MRKFGRLNRWVGPAVDEQPEDNLTVATNVDQWQEGYVRPRDGLSRPTTFTGIIHHNTTLTTRDATVTFGEAIRSMMAGHVTTRGANPLTDAE